MRYTIKTDDAMWTGTAADAIQAIETAARMGGWAYVTDENGDLLAGHSGDRPEPRTWGRDGLTEIAHTQDAQCDIDPDTLLCRECGVEHSDPCPCCGGRAFHQDDCPEVRFHAR